MADVKLIKSYQLTLAGVFGGLVSGAIVATVLLLSHGRHGLNQGQGGGLSTSSPIKVRGGSMTIRAAHKWKPIPASTAYCTNASVTKVYVDQPDGSGYPVVKLTSSWKVEIHGRTPDGSSDSGNGIILQPQNSACNLGTTDQPVQLSVIAHTNSSFYPPLSTIDEDSTNSERFEDLTPDGASRGCQGPNGNPLGDEDACERISKVILTPDTAHPSIPPINCLNGECTVRLEH